MCTATWWIGADGYELFFNRDELKTRAKALQPIMHQLGDVKYLAPIDPTGGGTWLLVNEFGLTVCLINQYPDSPRDPGMRRISRGQLVRSLANCPDADTVRQRVANTDLTRYEAFLLIALEPGSSGRILRWDTHELTKQNVSPEPQVFTSSSHLPDEVLRSRRRRFGELVKLRSGDPTPDDLRAFHEHFAPQTAAQSVFMQRDDASTVSLTHVAVEAESITLEYAPRLPNTFQFDRARRVKLPRRTTCIAL